MSNEILSPDLKIQLDLLAHAFPGRTEVRLSEATHAISMSPKWWFRRAGDGVPPFPARLQGNKRIVRLVDLAMFCAAPAAAEIADSQPVVARELPAPVALRVGRPTKSEEQMARAAGFATVKLLRAAQRAAAIDEGATK